MTAPAHADFCIEPRAPSQLFLSKPSKPYCAASRSCSQFEVTAYRKDVDRYFQQLKDYLAEVDRFNKKAYEYAQCMAQLD